VKASGLGDQPGKHRVIIPGYVAQISGEVEEGLPGWEVLVGPGEASDIGSFMKIQAAR
jgi:acetyl-CoA decarbonylase/synthase complex subunit gamma